MKCRQVSEMLHEGGPPAGGLRVRAHLVVCRRCRAEARSLRVVREAVEEFGRYEPSADLLPAILAVPNESAPLQIPVKEERGMRRIVFASIAIVAVLIGGAIVIPGRWKKPDARSILIGVAHAMEEAKSLHILFRGTESGVKTPTGLRMSPFPLDLWFTSRAIYGRAVAADGTLVFSSAADADRREMWVYSPDDKIRLVADLTPIAERAAEVISVASKLFRSDQIMKTVGKAYPDAKMSVATETRDGRKVAVITVAGTLKTSPRRVLGRHVFVVDAETNRLLDMRQYARTDSTREELIARIDRVDYDVPVPSEARALEVPEGTKTVPATANVFETKNTMGLVMRSGKHVLRYEVPREK
jgi:hypothetical protein